MKRLLVVIAGFGLAVFAGGCSSESSNGSPDTGGSSSGADAGGPIDCAALATRCGNQCCNKVNQYCNGTACATCACATGQECGTDPCGAPCGANSGGCPTGKTCSSENKCVSG